jgi:hypothetical protein
VSISSKMDKLVFYMHRVEYYTAMETDEWLLQQNNAEWQGTFLHGSDPLWWLKHAHQSIWGCLPCVYHGPEVKAAGGREYRHKKLKPASLSWGPAPASPTCVPHLSLRDAQGWHCLEPLASDKHTLLEWGAHRAMWPAASLSRSHRAGIPQK